MYRRCTNVQYYFVGIGFMTIRDITEVPEPGSHESRSRTRPALHSVSRRFSPGASSGACVRCTHSTHFEQYTPNATSIGWLVEWSACFSGATAFQACRPTPLPRTSLSSCKSTRMVKMLVVPAHQTRRRTRAGLSSAALSR